MSSSEAQQQHCDGDTVPVQSVVDYEPLGGSCISLDDILVGGSANGMVDDDFFQSVLIEAVLALDTGLHAQLITTGSSGSYYITDRQKVGYDR